MTSQPGGLNRRALAGHGLTLDYPMSLGVFERYEQAQHAVDYLSDHEFPVENCMIVGTDLKQVERVTGRLTRGRVAGAGALSGMWMGLFVGLIFSLFAANRGVLTIVSTVIFGALFGLVWALIGYAATHGQRDFTSVNQVVATRYEVLVEHKFAERAREMLARMPGGGPALTA
jgi:Heat induced stress protein YflT domain